VPDEKEKEGLTQKKGRPHGNKLSLHPLSFEEALSNALKVPPPKDEKKDKSKANKAKKAKTGS
jgi:hypothetical protein